MASDTTAANHPAPEVIARGILLKDAAVLLCQNRAKGYFYLPGGHVDPGETAAEALAREFDEETGLTVHTGPCRAIFEVLFGKGGQEMNLVFHVEHQGELPDQVASQEDDIAFIWADLATLVDLDLRPRSIKAWLVGGGGPDPKAPAGAVEFISDREDA